MYKTQCPAFFHKDLSNDGGMKQILALQRKLQFDYLQNMVDLFDRYRVKNMDTGTLKTVNDWVKDSRHFQMMRNRRINIRIPNTDTTTTYDQLIQSAVRSYGLCDVFVLIIKNDKNIESEI